VAAIKAGVDCLPAGVKMVLNSGARRARDVPGAVWARLAAEFYSRERTTANLEMLARFYERYPNYADRTFLSVKVRSASLPASRPRI
jgi:pyridoxine 4-dehydrogenase